MNWLEVADYEEMSRYGAFRIGRIIRERTAEGKPVHIGLATGNTMLTLYRLLAEEMNRNGIDLRNFHTWHLDEYVGEDGHAVPPEHPLSYRKYMRENLFGRFDPRLGFTEDHAHFPSPENPGRFDDEFRAAGATDLQLLGIGFNGHIAFNEPQSSTEISAEEFAVLPTRVIPLKELTIQTNARLTADGSLDTVPKKAVTMGMKQILQAKELLLLACFREQEIPLKKMRTMKAPSPELPASYLLTAPASETVYTGDRIHL